MESVRKSKVCLTHSKTHALERMLGSNPFPPAQVHVNQVYYPPPGTANAYGYNGMPMAEVAQSPPNIYSYAGMPMAEAALAPRPISPVHRSTGWCTCCCGPCGRWSKRRWVIFIILIVVVIAVALVTSLVLTVAVQNAKGGQGLGG